MHKKIILVVTFLAFLLITCKGRVYGADINYQEKLRQMAAYRFTLTVEREPMKVGISGFEITEFPVFTEDSSTLEKNKTMEISLLDNTGKGIYIVHIPLIFEKFPAEDESIDLSLSNLPKNDDDILRLIPKNDHLSFDVVIPFREQAVKMVISYNSQTLGEKDVSMFCHRDKVCTSPENYLSCPADCSPNAKDGFCNYYPGKSGPDPDCPTGLDWDSRGGKTLPLGIDGKQKRIFFVFVLLICFVLLLGGFILIFLKLRKKRRDTVDSSQDQPPTPEMPNTLT